MSDQEPGAGAMNTTDSNSSDAKETLPDRVSCLLLPVSDGHLLIPVTAIAEVVSPLFPPEDSRAEGAFYGWINWRDQNVPLISYEVLCGGKPRLPWREVERLAVFNAVGRAASSGFYALALTAAPRSVTVAADTAFGESPQSGATSPLLVASVDGVEAEVPNVEYLEDVVATLRYY